MAFDEEEDVNRLLFGGEFTEVRWLPNAFAALAMDASAAQKKQHSKKAPPEAFLTAMEYAHKFSGALAPPLSTPGLAATATISPATAQELYDALYYISFTREGDDGDVKKLRLHDYQIAALINLNPPTRDSARALIPSLDEFTDDELHEVLTILRRGTSKFGTVAKFS